jgi:hypothetical protein
VGRLSESGIDDDAAVLMQEYRNKIYCRILSCRVLSMWTRWTRPLVRQANKTSLVLLSTAVTSPVTS